MHLRRLIAGLLALALVAGAARAQQASTVMPTVGPMDFSHYNSDHLNPALLSILSSNAGNTPPTNGPGNAPVTGEPWLDQSTNPYALRYFDGNGAWPAALFIDPAGHTIALSAAENPAQHAASYTVADADRGSLQVFTLSGAATATLATPGATGLFVKNWFADFQNSKSSTAALTLQPPGGITIDGGVTLALQPGQGVRVVSDGTNYQVWRAFAIVPFTAPTHQFVNAVNSAGQLASLQPACGDLSNAAASCSTDATNAANISSGTLPPARLPAPAASTLGGIESVTCGTSQWLWQITTAGVPNCKQPAFADISGTATLGQGGTGQTTAPAARASGGLNIDACTSTGDANYTMLATDRCVTHTALTAARTDTLPAANAVNVGQVLRVVDLRGLVTGTSTITVARAGADTVNGGTSATALSSAFALAECVSDGISRWTCQGLSGGGGGAGVTSVTIAAGAGTAVSGTCTITTSGTCTISSGMLGTTTVAGASTTFTSAQNNLLVLRSNSGSPMIDTLPGTSPGILPANTLITVENNDAAGVLAINVGAGAALKASVSATGWVYICPGQSVGFFSDGTNYWAAQQPVTCYLNASTTFFAAATGGSATNHGLTAAAPLNGITPAYNLAKVAFNASRLNPATKTITIQLADGTYSAAFVQNAIPGQGVENAQLGQFPVIIQGNLTTPANVVVTGGGTTDALTVAGTASLLLQGFTLVSPTTGDDLVVDGARVGIQNLVFGASTINQMLATHRGFIEVAGNYSISGGAQGHWQTSDNGSIYLQVAATVTYTTGGLIMSSCFACAQFNGTIVFNGVTPTFAGPGPGGGVKFNATFNAIIATGGTTLPGTVAGTTSFGGQEN